MGMHVFGKLFRKLNYLLTLGQKQQRESGKKEEKPLTGDLPFDLTMIQNILGTSNDISYRRFKIGVEEATLIFIDGLVDKAMINDHILHPLMVDAQLTGADEELARKNLVTQIGDKILTAGEIKPVKEMSELVNGVLSGNTALLLDRSEKALLIDTRGWPARGIEEPETEVVVRGPREGFTETMRTNTALLRRKIRDPNLTFDTVRLGVRTKTDITIAYIKGIAKDTLVEEIKKRLKNIHTDAILESGYIEEFIEDNPLSIFSSIGNSEKPDTVAAKILEGRAAIIVDGTPIVLTVPMLFIESFQTADDYYSRSPYTSLLRFIRFLGFLFSVFSPAIYVALVAFHQELLPTPLLMTVAAASEGTPFPSIVELLGMGLLFEILREAGVRIPRSMGQAVSIVGALVIGEAAVSAGLIGAPVVIVVALTAIASFTVTPQADAATILRFLLTLAAGAFGMFGIVIVVIQMVIHLVSLRSFGVPYLSPLAPFSINDWKDLFFRVPWWAMKSRPESIEPEQRIRQGAKK
ncbi:spore germination protein [Candidatus Formimonas warabiya]|uniref:Spore germination protein n=1 Tax=Formimonas warabiya TaxID=1761012 RepID=A0A3G1L1K7_FORW1|nr:spore germination protein [Candidatus Formimonas warabiya]